MKKIVAMLIALVMLASMAVTVQAEGSSAVVETTHGAVQGVEGEYGYVFHGIPYGDFTGGENRFLPVGEAQDWEGVLDCTKNGPISPQVGKDGISIVNPKHEQSWYFTGNHPENFCAEDEVEGEDCLVLNVTTPAIDDAKRPVLVYIHGGGYTTESGSITIGAGKFAQQQDLVVVGINHRLNAFGYLYLGALDEKYAESGTAGMMDLIVALKWVKDNIAAFGGDPDNLTVLGESGGSMKISTLLAMPEAEGLFEHAVLISGPGVPDAYSPEQAAAQTQKLLDSLGLTGDGWKELLTMDIDALEDAVAAAGMSFKPVADDIHLAYRPENDHIAYEWSKDIPLVIGCSEDEWGSHLDPHTYDGLTWDNLKERLLAAGYVTESNADAVCEVLAQLPDNKGDVMQAYAMMSMQNRLGDIACHAMSAGKTAQGQTCYRYLVTADTPAFSDANNRFAWHTATLPLQFQIVAFEEFQPLADIMSAWLGAFCRTGDPSTEEAPWPAFDLENRMVMTFQSEKAEAVSDPLGTLREAFEK